MNKEAIERELLQLLEDVEICDDEMDIIYDNDIACRKLELQKEISCSSIDLFECNSALWKEFRQSLQTIDATFVDIENNLIDVNKEIGTVVARDDCINRSERPLSNEMNNGQLHMVTTLSHDDESRALFCEHHCTVLCPSPCGVHCNENCMYVQKLKDHENDLRLQGVEFAAKAIEAAQHKLSILCGDNLVNLANEAVNDLTGEDKKRITFTNTLSKDQRTRCQIIENLHQDREAKLKQKIEEHSRNQEIQDKKLQLEAIAKESTIERQRNESLNKIQMEEEKQKIRMKIEENYHLEILQSIKEEEQRYQDFLLHIQKKQMESQRQMDELSSMMDEDEIARKCNENELQIRNKEIERSIEETTAMQFEEDSQRKVEILRTQILLEEKRHIAAELQKKSENAEKNRELLLKEFEQQKKDEIEKQKQFERLLSARKLEKAIQKKILLKKLEDDALHREENCRREALEYEKMCTEQSMMSQQDEEGSLFRKVDLFCKTTQMNELYTMQNEESLSSEFNIKLRMEDKMRNETSEIKMSGSIMTMDMQLTSKNDKDCNGKMTKDNEIGEQAIVELFEANATITPYVITADEWKGAVKEVSETKQIVTVEYIEKYDEMETKIDIGEEKERIIKTEKVLTEDVIKMEVMMGGKVDVIEETRIVETTMIEEDKAVMIDEKMKVEKEMIKVREEIGEGGTEIEVRDNTLKLEKTTVIEESIEMKKVTRGTETDSLKEKNTIKNTKTLLEESVEMKAEAMTRKQETDIKGQKVEINKVKSERVVNIVRDIESVVRPAIVVKTDEYLMNRPVVWSQHDQNLSSTKVLGMQYDLITQQKELNSLEDFVQPYEWKMQEKKCKDHMTTRKNEIVVISDKLSQYSHAPTMRPDSMNVGKATNQSCIQTESCGPFGITDHIKEALPSSNSEVLSTVPTALIRDPTFKDEVQSPFRLRKKINRALLISKAFEEDDILYKEINIDEFLGIPPELDDNWGKPQLPNKIHNKTFSSEDISHYDIGKLKVEETQDKFIINLKETNNDEKIRRVQNKEVSMKKNSLRLANLRKKFAQVETGRKQQFYTIENRRRRGKKKKFNWKLSENDSIKEIVTSQVESPAKLQSFNDIESEEELRSYQDNVLVNLQSLDERGKKEVSRKTKVLVEQSIDSNAQSRNLRLLERKKLHEESFDDFPLNISNQDNEILSLNCVQTGGWRLRRKISDALTLSKHLDEEKSFFKEVKMNNFLQPSDME